MTTELDTTRAVRAWLQEGATHLPDRVLDAVMADVPHTPQVARARVVALHPRRQAWVRLLVALMTLAIIGASLVVATGAWRTAPIPRPFDAIPLEAGRYVIDRPFPVRISLDIPSGWEGVEVTGDTATVAHPSETDIAPSLTFTLVEGVYPDPCHFDAASIQTVGPTVDDLVAALEGTQGVQVATPTSVTLGGYPARTLTVAAPQSFTDCSNEDPDFRLWGLPQMAWMAPGERDRIWVSQVGSTRLTVVTRAPTSTTPAVEGELDAMVASVRLEEFAAIPVPTPPGPSIPTPTPDPPWPVADVGTPLRDVGFVQKVRLYELESNGSRRAIPGLLDAAFQGVPGWFGSDPGVVSDLGSAPQARVGWWSIAKVYLDPCHSQTSALGTAEISMVQSQDGMVAAFTDRWPTRTDPDGHSDSTSIADAPIVAAPPKAIAWLGLVQQIQLEIPADLDTTTCDGGEYRLWEAVDGRIRTAQPGERIQLDIVDYKPGILVVDTAWLPTASPGIRDAMDTVRSSLWIGRA